MFPVLISTAQFERLNEVVSGAQETGRTVAGIDLYQPLGTNVLSVRPVFDNGEDAAEGERYEPGDESYFAVCGKDITDEVAAMRAEQDAEQPQTDEKVEVEA